ERDHLGVCGGVGVDLAPIVAAADDEGGGAAAHDHRADGHLAHPRRALRQRQRTSHVSLVLVATVIIFEGRALRFHQRGRGDSNPRRLSAWRFSRPLPSTTRPLLPGFSPEWAD